MDTHPTANRVYDLISALNSALILAQKHGLVVDIGAEELEARVINLQVIPCRRFTVAVYKPLRHTIETERVPEPSGSDFGEKC